MSQHWQIEPLKYPEACLKTALITGAACTGISGLAPANAQNSAHSAVPHDARALTGSSRRTRVFGSAAAADMDKQRHLHAHMMPSGRLKCTARRG